MGGVRDDAAFCTMLPLAETLTLLVPCTVPPTVVFSPPNPMLPESTRPAIARSFCASRFTACVAVIRALGSTRGRGGDAIGRNCSSDE